MYRFAMKFLETWKNDSDRKPLIIRGARQVGKSYLARYFGDNYFDSIVEINFEQTPKSAALFLNNHPVKTIALLEVEQSQSIVPGKTLLFLDEIQAAPKVLASLRYFYEQMPDLHIIAAGSLLEFVLEEHSFSMPVGRIEYMHLGPMSFEEFLLASGKDKKVDLIQNMELTDNSFNLLHDSFLQDFRDYCVIGGMPAAINAYIEHHSYLAVERIHEGILTTYRDDFNKYQARVNHQRLIKVFSRIPLLVTQKFKYTNLDRDLQSRELSKTVHLLELARIVYKVKHTSSNGIPLGAETNDRHFKMLFLDVGLLCRACNLDLTDIHNTDDVMLVNKGVLCEQFIGQHLLYANQFYKEPQLYCWMHQKHNTSSEVDYVIQAGSDIIPVEVKAGKTGRLKSLHVFLAEKSRSFALRFNADVPSFVRAQTTIAGKEGKDFSLLSLPLYLVGQSQRLCRKWIEA